MGLKVMWDGLGRGARWGLGIGAAAILTATALLGYWALHTEYEVLFTKVSPQDAAAMTHELEQLKVPYRLADAGATILVDSAVVHQTRLKLMGKDLPLRGAVGFELFNNSDFGMTEFAQKVNYQRALQGELTRTILSLAEVESARVHVAFPEDGLFKREQGRTKASITLTLRDGHALQREQVRGIQRLVAAAVTGIESRDVTIVNDRGVAVTQDGESSPLTGAPSLRMELKREVEEYLATKANSLLEKTFGPGQAMASVDVTLDMNQVRVTTEDVTTPPVGKGESPVGVVLRERETTRDPGRGNGLTAGDANSATSTQREVDYQLGRRVEQVVTSPGAVSRLQVLAVLRAPLNASQVEKVSQLLANAVGASRDRGDVVTVQTLEGFVATASSPGSATGLQSTGSKEMTPRPTSTSTAGNSSGARPGWFVSQSLAGLLVAVTAMLTAFWWRRGQRAANRSAVKLNEADRRAALAQIQAWLAQGDRDQPRANER